MDAVIEQKEKWINIGDAKVIMTNPLYKKIVFSDGTTKLSDYLSALENSKNLEKFLLSIASVNVALPSDSLLWPGSTPLHLAVMFSQEMEYEDKAAHIVNLCLKRGAQVQVKNQRGETPLHLAFRLGQQKIVTLIMRILETQSETVVNLVDNDNLSYLHIACSAKDHRNSLARKLLSIDGDLAATVNLSYKGQAFANMKTGWTPLHIAVDQCHHYFIELLLQRGADIFRIDVQGSTAIHQLFGTTGSKLVADVLFASEHLRECVNPGTGLTHLHVAVWFNDLKSVQRLLDVGSDIEATVKGLEGKDMKKFEGCTPLCMAMILDHSEIAITLIDRGANVLAKTIDDTSPLSSMLNGYCSSVSTMFIRFLWNDVISQKRLKEELGLTMLHVACYTGDVDQVAALIDKGVNVNARISDHSNFWMGFTPLHALINSYALIYSSEKKVATIQKLLQADCNVDQQDSTGKTALHLAAIRSTPYGSRKVEDALLSAGADVNIVDHSGKSALSYASEARSRDLLNCLALLVQKMKLIGIEVSELNENLLTTVFNDFNPTHELSSFCDQVQEIEKIIIGRPRLTLRSFMFETGAISRYPSLTPADRSEVDAFFQSISGGASALIWKFLCNLQHRKAVARLSLIEPAVDALKDLISPSFPDLCIEIILKYLSNSELKKLIAASQTVDG